MGTSFLLFLVASFAGHVWAQKESGEGGMTAYANMESPRNTSLRLYEDFKNLDRTIAFLQEKGLIHKEKLCRNGHSMKLRKRDDRYRWRRHNASCLLEVGPVDQGGSCPGKTIRSCECEGSAAGRTGNVGTHPNCLPDLSHSRTSFKRSVRMLFFNPNDVNEAPVAVKSTAEITNFDNSLDTVVIIHGFADYYPGSYLIPALVKAYATYDKKNVIALDWGDLASAPWYLTAARNTFRVGEWLAAFLTAMMEVQNLSMDRLELVGFSLGAHIAGVASSLLSSQPRRIIGLDPAELLFAESPVEFILDKSDAPLVEIIHTSGGFIGFKRPIGHRDFYPNGGEHPQPGCEGDFAGTCSHRRAYQYFAEALLRRGRGFKATKCTSFEDFKAGKCQEGPRLSIANNNYDPNLRGTYFLMTNPTKPFGMKQA